MAYDKGKILDLDNTSPNIGLAQQIDDANFDRELDLEFASAKQVNTNEPSPENPGLDLGAIHEAQEIDAENKPVSSKQYSEYYQQHYDKPLVKLINLDLSYARVGVVMMFGRLLMSMLPNSFRKKQSTEDYKEYKEPFNCFYDLLLKLRQVCQYSIHARPSHIARNPDDISADAVHNLEAVALGRRVYRFNAFIAPWLAPLKLFFPDSDNSIIGAPSRLLHCLDQVIGKVTNLFWNIRRISMALLPYSGGVTSDALAEEQNEVKEIVGYFTNTTIIRPIKALINSLFDKDSQVFDNQIDFYKGKPKAEVWSLISGAAENYLHNFKALFSATYKPVGSNVPVEVGSEEPHNNKLYVRSKLLSQVIGLPAGVAGAVLNSLSIGLNVFGHAFKTRKIVDTSDHLNNLANSLMAMVYLTGEVPANINEFMKRRKIDGETHYGHLGVAGIGVLGMLNRIKYAPFFGSVLDKIGVKSFLDKFHNQFEQLFFGFFSANRWMLHGHEKELASKVAPAKDLEDAKKHDNFYKHFTLPFRTILGDPDVTYKEDNQNFYRSRGPTTSPV